MDASQIARDCLVVTPSDTDPCEGVGFMFIGGDCAVLTDRGKIRVIPAAFAGVPHIVGIQKVLAAGTTATSVLVYRA